MGLGIKGGEQALVIFSDRSIMKNHRLRQFRGSFQAISQEVDRALLAGGLQPSSATAARIDLGGRFFEDHFYEGNYGTLYPNGYMPDLTEVDFTLFGGDWNDKISSIQMGRCWFQGWEDINENGASLTLYEDTPELDSIGWNDCLSGIWFPFRS